MPWYNEPSSSPTPGEYASGVGLLMSYGVDQVQRSLAMAYLFTTPHEMDSASGPFRTLAKAAQQGLRAKKYITVQADGIIGADGPTARALSLIINDWSQKSWYQILIKIRDAKVYSPPNPSDPTDPRNAQPGLFSSVTESVGGNPMLLIGGGLLLYVLLTGKKGRK